MNFKSLTASAVFLSSVSAMAFNVPVALYTFRSGPVAPQYREENRCLLRIDGTLVKNRSIGGRSEKPVIKKIAFTAEIKDMDALIAIRDKAQDGKLKRSGVAPVGGPIRTYSAVEMLPGDRTKTTVVKQSGGIVQDIASPASAKAAATKLVQFLDFNCNQQ